MAPWYGTAGRPDEPARRAARRALRSLVHEQLPALRRAAEDTGPRSAAVPAPARVWVFWAQGVDRAPALVRRCVDELRARHEPGQVVVLDRAAVDDHVDLPGDIVDAVGDDWTHFADVLRMELMSRHGGVWLDATCLVRDNLVRRLEAPLAPAGFFALRRHPRMLATWCMASRPGHYVPSLVREAQYAYLRRFGRVTAYYYLHRLFQALYDADDRFRAMWDRMPEQRARPALLVRKALQDPYDPVAVRRLLDGSWVHKLSYKVDGAALDGDTVIAHLVRHGAPG